jgi:type II secretory pathway pseudopilin PulG
MDGMKSDRCIRRTRFSGCVRVRAANKAHGFTVVELIATIILLSILGVVAMSRMVSPDLFAPAIVTQALVAETRFAQQVATSRHDAVVTLTVDRVGGDWRFQVDTDVDGVVRTELVVAEDTTVQATSGAADGAIGGGATLALSFDHAGDLADVTINGVSGDPAAGVALTIAGASTRQACIYPSGYANDDACS